MYRGIRAEPAKVLSTPQRLGVTPPGSNPADWSNTSAAPASAPSGARHGRFKPDFQGLRDSARCAEGSGPPVARGLGSC
jgi:hypothetical protein